MMLRMHAHTKLFDWIFRLLNILTYQMSEIDVRLLMDRNTNFAISDLIGHGSVGVQ